MLCSKWGGLLVNECIYYGNYKNMNLFLKKLMELVIILYTNNTRTGREKRKRHVNHNALIIPLFNTSINFPCEYKHVVGR